MIHDPSLLDTLAALPVERFEGEVFRTTRQNLDPLAHSTSGGRWAPTSELAVLYTSLEPDGALAEIAFHWSQLAPVPSKPVVLHRLRVSAPRSLRLIRADLPTLGVDMSRYSEIGYQRTQEIGAAAAFLENDGIIVPSARWDCDNLVLFNDNILHVTLEVVNSEERDWREWCRQRGR